MLFILKLSKKAFSIKRKKKQKQYIEGKGPKRTKNLKFWYFFHTTFNLCLYITVENFEKYRFAYVFIKSIKIPLI